MSAWLEESIDDPGLRDAVQDVLASCPSSICAFKGLIDYYNSKLALNEQSPEPEPKRHKSNHTVVTTILDVSFNIPARRKFNIVITTSHLQLINPKTQIPEYTYPLEEIQIGACTPTPDKAQKHYTFTLFVKNQDSEAIVFNIQDKGDLVIKTPGQEDRVLSQAKDITLTQIFQNDAHLSITQPSKELFTSSVVSPTTGKREHERLYVNGFLRNKEGSLFFLSQGVLFGFKKPTFLIPVKHISSIVISTVTQHTFDLSLKLKKNMGVYGAPLSSITGGAKNKEEDQTTIVFSMIERSEYIGIDAYIKTSGIHDNSMTEETKAPESKLKSIGQKDNVDTQENGMVGEDGDDYDEENDHDFVPSDYNDDPLEYDTDASSEGDEDYDNEGKEEFRDNHEEMLDSIDQLQDSD
ncbi:hypothetical protein CLU79DRAFT_767564 [Phycomyces nitens]|nr:hypothetical protein CLU79DRAFT_767564 [Phycomyces nitens]